MPFACMAAMPSAISFRVRYTAIMSDKRRQSRVQSPNQDVHKFKEYNVYTYQEQSIPQHQIIK
jgi:uncharacterized protein (UPF0248 family)